MTTLVGRRIYDLSREKLPWREPGAYWFSDGWWAVTPNGLVGNLSNHEVIEHDDGTITVSPSILVDGETSWHGYLRAGVWESV